jgi:hypothetical protein
VNRTRSLLIFTVLMSARCPLDDRTSIERTRLQTLHSNTTGFPVFKKSDASSVNRTRGLQIFSLTLSQLSYWGIVLVLVGIFVLFKICILWIVPQLFNLLTMHYFPLEVYVIRCWSEWRRQRIIVRVTKTTHAIYLLLHPSLPWLHFIITCLTLLSHQHFVIWRQML